MQGENTKIALMATVSVATVATLYLLCQKRPFKDRDEVANAKPSSCVYLDYNGTTPIYPEVYEAMIPYFTEHFGNPGSTHCLGDRPRRAVEHARQTILQALFSKKDSPAMPNSILFCACGTEADNMAIHLALQQTKQAKPHIVTTNVEHPAVAKCLMHYEKSGRCTITYVPVGVDGCVGANKIMAAVQSNTVLVAVMLANNESGALQPVKEIVKECRKRNVLVFTDAAQAVGKVDIKAIDADMVAVVGHKIGAPKGIACLYVRDGSFQNDCQQHTPLLHGGGQEFGLRGGTENVPYIVGLATAVELAARNLSRNVRHMESMRHRLCTRLKDSLGKDTVVVHGPTDPKLRLPNTLSVAFRNKENPNHEIQSTNILLAVRDQVAASAGATCHQQGNSSVLSAMKIPPELARATIRLSVGPYTTIDEIDSAASILVQTVKAQSMAPVDAQH